MGLDPLASATVSFPWCLLPGGLRGLLGLVSPPERGEDLLPQPVEESPKVQAEDGVGVGRSGLASRVLLLQLLQ